MRTVYIAAVGLILTAAQLATADVMLEDFSGITVSESYPEAAFHSGNLRTSGLKSSYCFYNSGSLSVTDGQFTATTSQAQLFELKFGTRATGPNGTFSNDISTFMNANWNNVIGIKLNISSLSAPLQSGGFRLNTNDNQGYLLGSSTRNDSVVINSVGSFIIPMTGLTPAYLSGANLADVDALNLSFWLPSGRSTPFSWTLDSVELVEAAVPEPATASMSALGAAALLLRRRRA